MLLLFIFSLCPKTRRARSEAIHRASALMHTIHTNTHARALPLRATPLPRGSLAQWLTVCAGSSEGGPCRSRTWQAHHACAHTRAVNPRAPARISTPAISTTARAPHREDERRRVARRVPRELRDLHFDLQISTPVRVAYHPTAIPPPTSAFWLNPLEPQKPRFVVCSETCGGGG